jgi:hypothetical protein
MCSQLNLNLNLQGQTSPIFNLPAELRCNIYEEVLVSKWPSLPLELNSPGGGSLLPPALLQTCRVIRHEAQPIYYSENTFEARQWGAPSNVQHDRESIAKFLAAWLKPLKASNCLHLVRRIKILEVFWVNPLALADLKKVNFALARHGVAVATDVLHVLTKWDDDFWNTAITNPKWLGVQLQWESWASILNRVKAEEGESPKYLKEAKAHAAWIDSLELPKAIVSRVCGTRQN